MKYVAAYLLAMAGGDSKPTVEKIKTILESVGVNVDEAKLAHVMKQFEGKDIEQTIKEGSSKMISCGVATASAPVAGGASTGPAPVAKKEEEAPAAAAPLDLGDMFGDF